MCGIFIVDNSVKTYNYLEKHCGERRSMLFHSQVGVQAQYRADQTEFSFEADISNKIEAGRDVLQ